MDHILNTVGQALRAASPHELMDKLRPLLGEHYGISSADLLMADYALVMLQPVTTLPFTSHPLHVHDTAPGQAFDTQEPNIETVGESVTAHLPITVRGDRLGVLSVGLPHEDPAAIRELQEIATVLGREILVAERDTDLYLQARRATRLTLAAEMQWQLLPGRACARPEYTIGAQLEPAYAIYGDNFDWSTSADHLSLSVLNGMGEGIDAALLTNLAVNAMRNARRAGISLTDQAMLADQAIFGQYGGRMHVAALLLHFDLTTGEVDIIDAGSPQLWRMRADAVDRVELEAQLPLGMFEDTPYVAQHLRMAPGDRLLFVTDGVYDAASPAGQRYGEQALAEAMRATRSMPATHVPRALLQELGTHRDPTATAPAPDDAMVLCLDWHGRATE